VDLDPREDATILVQDKSATATSFSALQLDKDDDSGDSGGDSHGEDRADAKAEPTVKPAVNNVLGDLAKKELGAEI
jgi:hypothetical protein